MIKSVDCEFAMESWRSRCGVFLPKSVHRFVDVCPDSALAQIGSRSFRTWTTLYHNRICVCIPLKQLTMRLAAWYIHIGLAPAPPVEESFLLLTAAMDSGTSQEPNFAQSTKPSRCARIQANSPRIALTFSHAKTARYQEGKYRCFREDSQDVWILKRFHSYVTGSAVFGYTEGTGERRNHAAYGIF